MTATTTPHLPGKVDPNVVILGALVFAMAGMVLAVAAKVVEIDRKVRILADRHSMTEEEWVARQGTLLDQITAGVTARLAAQGGAVLAENGHSHVPEDIVGTLDVPRGTPEPSHPGWGLGSPSVTTPDAAPPMVTRWPDAPDLSHVPEGASE